MIVKRIELKNFQVLKDLSANFEGNVYFITGDNELGKSTMLKAIGCLLTGERDPLLTNGEEKGFAKMIVGDDKQEFEVKLSYTKKNPRGTLTITGKDGMKSDNLSMLQKIFAYQDFDAVEFSEWSETAEGRRKQVEAVRALLPKEVQDEIDKIDSDVERIKEDRKEQNSILRGQNSFVEQSQREIAGVDISKYEKAKPIEDLMQRQRDEAALIEKAKSAREKVELRKKQLAEIPELIKSAKEVFSTEKQEVERLKKQAKVDYDNALEKLAERLSKAEKVKKDSLDLQEANKKEYSEKLAAGKDWLAKYDEENPEGNSVADQVKEAADHNKIYEKVLSYKQKVADRDKTLTVVQKHDADLDEKLAKKADLIKKSNLPIEGLTFSQDGLELKGVPFVAGKVSDSQIMEVAAKLIIASNKNVKIFRIARGESLGKKRLADLIKLAKDNGYQGFIEEVKRGQENLVIEEYIEG